MSDYGWQVAAIAVAAFLWIFVFEPLLNRLAKRWRR